MSPLNVSDPYGQVTLPYQPPIELVALAPLLTV